MASLHRPRRPSILPGPGLTESPQQRRWDERHRGGAVGEPVPFVVEVVDRLPTGGRALDVAGGTGGTSLFLVEHGLETTLVDISPVALDLATAEAHRRGLALTTIHANLES
ncbi:MAG: class I SAM-dependent methyltransferase, partial [Actinomycetia bacterium]|nr:class I SAM-dependent methyltransferase [Actinomycetes bacterium]